MSLSDTGLKEDETWEGGSVGAWQHEGETIFFMSLIVVMKKRPLLSAKHRGSRHSWRDNGFYCVNGYFGSFLLEAVKCEKYFDRACLIALFNEKIKSSKGVVCEPQAERISKDAKFCDMISGSCIHVSCVQGNLLY